ncbi:PREDICTED: uncharacterized protein LOC109343234 isoform X2 [Lupinus angustifolius]|uniref:uncharacterized protein LOC109343234 isoform X2 n=1 Tax=Lupinus angustifolius TaxID=3871 RepID=UPI00092F6F80|nr:PREDICTED: uncharacterized protein LOC109343234 isoform X2 [Lupinus angustifolius]
MAQQEQGWPLGLRLLNARIGLLTNGDFSNGSVSFTTLFTASATLSTHSSSDINTQSTRSLFRERSITFGSLIGISSNGRMVETSENYIKRNHKLKFCFFSLCSKLTTDAVSSNRTYTSNHL